MGTGDAIPGWQLAWAKAARNRDPVTFVTGVLGVLPHGVANPDEAPQLEFWQSEVLSAIRDGQERITVRSGHGVGKTSLLAWITLYGLLCCGPDTKIPIAAGSHDQLRDTIQPEIGKWHRKLPPLLQQQIDVQSERVVVRAAPDEAFAVFRTASKDNPQALAGFHAKTIIFLIDEASAVNEAAFEVAQGAFSTAGAICVCTGNPTKRQGFFFDTHNKLRDRWRSIRVSSEDVPRARGHIADVIAAYGKDSNKYRVRVLGEFPTHSDDTVIPLEWVEAARGRDVAKSNCWPIWGVDVARFGDDRTVLVIRQGNTLIRQPYVWRNLDGPQVAGRLIEMYNAAPNEMKPKQICVDVIGPGASVVDHLRLPGQPTRTLVKAVNVSEEASNSDKYYRLRDEIWFKGREWFAEKQCTFPRAGYDAPNAPDADKLIEEMVSELTGVTYDISVSGKIVVQSKKDMKFEGGKSPDLADAFLLTFAGGHFPRTVADAHRSYGDRAFDPWAI